MIKTKLLENCSLQSCLSVDTPRQMCTLQAEALALALGLLYHHGQGLHRWRDIEAETCHPWPPATFWRSANALGVRLHIVLVDKALQVSAEARRVLWRNEFACVNATVCCCVKWLRRRKQDAMS